MPSKARYFLGFLGGASLLAAVFTPFAMRTIPGIEPSFRKVAENPWIWVLIIVLLFQGVFFSPQLTRWRKPRIDVVAPLANNGVPLKTVVYGMVHPAHYPVRVMIFSGDRRYHRQDAPTIYSSDGTRWSIDCQFGNPDSEPNGEYEIAAIDGKVEIDAVCNSCQTVRRNPCPSRFDEFKSRRHE